MENPEQKSKANKLIVKQEGKSGAKATDVLVVGEEASEGQTRVKVRIDIQGRIVIPAFVRDELKINPNDTFWLIADSKGIALKKTVSKEFTLPRIQD